MSKKVYLWILNLGILASFFSVFLVNKNFLFPYISSKQIYFNIVIEVLTVFFIMALVKFPELRPKKSWITFGLLSYFFIILVLCFTGVDFNLSFWGDVERMLGFFHLAHFLIFYLIIITVFRTWNDWQILFNISIIASTLVALYGITNKIDYSTIGNTSYVAGYMIFNIFFAFLLIAKEKNWFIRPFYFIAIIFLLWAFKISDSSGGYVGFGIGLIVMLFLFSLFIKNKTKKIIALSSFAVFFILICSLFYFRNNETLKSTWVGNVINQISVGKNTFQTRLLSWRAAAKDFKNHPLLGTGFGNYAITFDKYFDPTFYNYTASETYFDRAHNNLIDITSTTGIFGLITYLSIFCAAGYYLINGFRKNKIVLSDFVLISSLVVAYFIQNLAVFDSLVTYISLMVLLGYIYYLSQNKEEEGVSLLKNYDEKISYDTKEIIGLLGLALIMSFIIFQYNYKVIKMLNYTILGQIYLNQGDLIKTYESYKKALSYNTPLDRDSRTSLMRSIYSTSVLNGLDIAKGNEILNYVIDLAEKNVDYNPKDSLAQLQLAQLYNTASQYNYTDQNKFFNYNNKALEAINKSIEASPRRIPNYFSKAQIYLTIGETKKSLETLEYALSLNTDYPDSYCQLAQLQFILKNENDGYKDMNVCLEKGGANLINSQTTLNKIATHYKEKKDPKHLAYVYEKYAQMSPNDANILVELSKIYLEAGDKENAINAANRAAAIDPRLKNSVEDYIKSLK